MILLECVETQSDFFYWRISTVLVNTPVSKNPGFKILSGSIRNKLWNINTLLQRSQSHSWVVLYFPQRIELSHSSKLRRIKRASSSSLILCCVLVIIQTATQQSNISPEKLCLNASLRDTFHVIHQLCRAAFMNWFECFSQKRRDQNILVNQVKSLD